MKFHSAPSNRLRTVCADFFLILFVILASLSSAVAQTNQAKSPDCRVEAVDYKSWHAQQLSNRWVQAVVVPQNGGRLMQVTFAGHAYLFVNPKFAGQYFPP